MPTKVSIKPLLLAYLKAKDAQSLHDALDRLSPAPSKRQIRHFVGELREAGRDTSAIESWCLKHGYTGAETTTGKKERPRRGMSKLYKTQYVSTTDEWYVRLPVMPLLEGLSEKDRKTNVVVLFQDDRIVVTLPEGFMRALRATVVEPEPAPEALSPKRRARRAGKAARG